MKTKEYLSQAWYLDKRIKTKERQLDWLKSHAVYVSPKLTEVPKAPSIRRSPVEEAVVRITELENEINTSIAQLMRLKTEIAEAIRSVNNMECELLLEMRYLTFLTWDEISTSLNFSSRYVYKLHNRALEMIHID
jgi:DNA-directed RNA polymerase specialized sigma subunit